MRFRAQFLIGLDHELGELRGLKKYLPLGIKVSGEVDNGSVFALINGKRVARLTESSNASLWIYSEAFETKNARFCAESLISRFLNLSFRAFAKLFGDLNSRSASSRGLNILTKSRSELFDRSYKALRESFCA